MQSPLAPSLYDFLSVARHMEDKLADALLGTRLFPTEYLSSRTHLLANDDLIFGKSPEESMHIITGHQVKLAHGLLNLSTDLCIGINVSSIDTFLSLVSNNHSWWDRTSIVLKSSKLHTDDISRTTAEIEAHVESICQTIQSSRNDSPEQWFLDLTDRFTTFPLDPQPSHV